MNDDLLDATLLVVRAPLRISFAGGGTDLPAYYERHGGLVLSATISRSVYVLLAAGDYAQVQITSADYRVTSLSSGGAETAPASLTLPRAVIEAMGVERGVSIALASDVPPGTGLGSSSATAVALITALAAYQGRAYTPAEVAELAAHVEIVRLGQPIGKQDQYAAAFGGINLFSFDSAGVAITPIPLLPHVQQGLEEHLVLYFTGGTRQAGNILREQRARTAGGNTATLDSLHALKEWVAPMHAALEAGDYARIGALLHESWQLKRRVSSGISTTAIDTAYAAARNAGALGGKVTGAGGGGFLLLLVPPAAQPSVHAALSALGLRRMPFKLAPRGAHVVVRGEHR